MKKTRKKMLCDRFSRLNCTRVKRISSYIPFFTFLKIFTFLLPNDNFIKENKKF